MVMRIILDKSRGQNDYQEISDSDIDSQECTTRLELLYEVAQKASSYSEVLKLIEEILCVTQRILQASAASLLLIDEGIGEICFQAVDGKMANMPRHMSMNLDSGIAGWVARHSTPVVTNDVSEDERFDPEMDEITGVVTRSIVAAPLLRGRKVIGVLEVLNKADGGIFDEHDMAFLTGFASTEGLILLVSMATTAIHNIRLRQEEISDHKKAVETLVAAADVKDPYAFGHSQRVREYTMLAADSLSFSPDELQIVEFGALLHDIGKIGVDDCILRKPTSLTNEEWYIMRKHSLIGANIVGEIPFLEKARGIVLHHHEWYNGTGYPEGIAGEDIPIGARLVAVADAFDTMVTEHSYRAALSVEEAVDELVRGSGTQFCPVAVKAFVSAFQKLKGEMVQKQAEQETQEKLKSVVKENDKSEYAAALRDEGIDMARLGKNEEALKALNKAIELDPGDAAIWRNRGTVLSRLGRDEEALEAFLEAIRLDPENAAAWRNKGTALVRMGRDTEALRDFMKAVELNPDYNTDWSSKVASVVGFREDKETRRIKKAERLAKREAEQAAREREKRKSEKVAKAAGSEKPVERQAERTDKKEASIKSQGASQNQDTRKCDRPVNMELCQGEVRLAIQAGGFQQVSRFKKCLRDVEGLTISSESWSEEDGIIIDVVLQKPVPLTSILSRVPIVDRVNKSNRNILVVLNN